MFLLQKASSKLLRGVCLIGVIAASQAQSALAQDHVTETARVSVRGLDLTTPEGESALRHRVRAAAYRVCGEDEAGVSLESDSFRQCVTDAMSGALPQIQALVASAWSKKQYAAASANQP